MGFPIALFIVMGVLLLTVVTTDSPKYYLVNDRKEDCLRAINKIYLPGQAEEVCAFVQSTIQTSSTSVKLSDALWYNERYKRASWVSICYIVFHEMTGINVIMMYSNTILETILGTGKSGGFTARQGTYAISLASTVSAVVGVFTAKSFPRKPLLLIGHGGIFLSHLLVAIFIITDVDLGVLIMICIFIFIYMNTSGPVAWLYAAETCCDVSLGVVLQVLWGTVLLLSLTSESLMDSALQPQGVFFLFAGISLLAVSYVFFFMDETRGLAERQKKELYIPGAKYGRKLEAGELPPAGTPTPATGRVLANISESLSIRDSQLRASQTTDGAERLRLLNNRKSTD